MTDVTPLYATVGSNDPARAMAFYGELLGTLGWNKVFDNPAGGAFYGHPNTGMFAVVTPFNEKTATVGNGTMAGFALASNAAVDAFYAKALTLGGTDEGAPGYRGPEEVGAYFAYFRDPEGNKLCAYCWSMPR
jgi:catechol 2,3-dioxygenase-like lactoylglutathione lyase family enzyme